MGHLPFGQDDRELDQSAHLAIHAPRRLIDQLSYAFLFDGIGVKCALKQLLDDRTRTLVVAVAHLLSDQRLTAPLGVHLRRLLIHVNDRALEIGNR